MVLVTAAGGMTGRHLVPALVTAGLRVRALGRSNRIHDVRGDHVETTAGDMLDPAVLARALRDIDAVIHIGPRFHPLEVAMGRAVIDGATAAGVRRFVQFSVHSPTIEFLVNHQTKAAVEDYLFSSSLEWTILQPQHYLQNFDPVQIVENGRFRLQYSLDTPLSFVDLDDVCLAAAKVLTEDGHAYASYPLCGSDVLTGHQIAAAVADRSGVEVRAEQIALPRFVETLTRGGPVPHYVIDGLYRLFTYYGLHGIRGNPNVLRWLLGREPSDFASYIDRSLGPTRSRRPERL